MSEMRPLLVSGFLNRTVGKISQESSMIQGALNCFQSIKRRQRAEEAMVKARASELRRPERVMLDIPLPL